MEPAATAADRTGAEAGPGDASADAPWYVRHRMRALLLTALIPLVVGLICFVVVSAYLSAGLRSHPVMGLALRTATASPEVAAAVGSDAGPGWWVMGGEVATVEGDGAPMEMMFNLRGDRGEAGVRVVAREVEPNAWRLTFLDVGLENAAGLKVVTLVDEERPVRFAVPGG